MTSGKKHLRWSSEELCLIVLSSLSNRGCAEETISCGCWFFVYSTVRRFSQVSILCIDALHFFNFLFNIGMLACNNCFFVDGWFYVCISEKEKEHLPSRKVARWVSISLTDAELNNCSGVYSEYHTSRTTSRSNSQAAILFVFQFFNESGYRTTACTAGQSLSYVFVHCCVLKVILFGGSNWRMILFSEWHRHTWRKRSPIAVDTCRANEFPIRTRLECPKYKSDGRRLHSYWGQSNFLCPSTHMSFT